MIAAETPIGPTGTAIEKPMASPLSKKVMSIAKKEGRSRHF